MPNTIDIKLTVMIIIEKGGNSVDIANATVAFSYTSETHAKMFHINLGIVVCSKSCSITFSQAFKNLIHSGCIKSTIHLLRNLIFISLATFVAVINVSLI